MNIKSKGFWIYPHKNITEKERKKMFQFLSFGDCLNRRVMIWRLSTEKSEIIAYCFSFWSLSAKLLKRLPTKTKRKWNRVEWITQVIEFCICIIINFIANEKQLNKLSQPRGIRVLWRTSNLIKLNANEANCCMTKWFIHIVKLYLFSSKHKILCIFLSLWQSAMQLPKAETLPCCFFSCSIKNNHA